MLTQPPPPPERGAVPASDAAAGPAGVVRGAREGVGPWPGFAVAAAAAVQDLHRRFGWDLWMVTHVDGPDQHVVASAGPWRDLAVTGRGVAWEISFCARMAHHDGPVAVPDVRSAPGYAQLAVGAYARVRAYAGIPLLTEDGHLFGTLCAFAGTPQPTRCADALPPAGLLAQMLSTIIARERTAAARSAEAAAAYALAERDPLTGLVNRRGWEAAVAREQHRVRRYDEPVTVLVVDLDDLKAVNDGAGHEAGDDLLRTCARTLAEHCRPVDVIARVGGDEFAVLATHCDEGAAAVLGDRLRRELADAGVAASLGHASCPPVGSVTEAAARADHAMYGHKRGGRA